MQSVHPDAQPIDLAGDRGAVLCLHGLSGSPYEIKPIAMELNRRGYRVLCPLLVGHGRSLRELGNSRWLDWLMSAKIAFDQLAKDWNQVTIVGFSMGGLLALKLAHDKGERVKGVAALAPAFEIDLVSSIGLKVVRRLGIAPFLPALPKTKGPDVSDPAIGHSMPSNEAIPIATAESLLDGQAAVEQVVSRLTMPVWIFQGKQDHTVPAHSARKLFSKLKMKDKKLIFYPKSWHILALDVEHDLVIEDVCGYVDRLYVPSTT
ncbi:MAG: alpha/beta fold hydrolase [Myxococcota bacterium]|nr:alpha/beta fold hydrolase [Myxococcota bacterium]